MVTFHVSSDVTKNTLTASVLYFVYLQCVILVSFSYTVLAFGALGFSEPWMFVFVAVLDFVRNHLQRVPDQTSNQHQPVINLRGSVMKLQQRIQQHMERKGGTEGLELWRAANDSHFISPTQGPLCLPWGASSSVCFHCAIQNKWEPQMRTGHLRNWNHEVCKKNTKKHSYHRLLLIMCVSLAVWGWWCVFRTMKWVRSIVFILSTCCILHKNTIYFSTISFWSCLSKQIKCHDIQNINTMISATTKWHWFSCVHSFIRHEIKIPPLFCKSFQN